MAKIDPPDDGLMYAIYGNASRFARRFPMTTVEDLVQEQLLWWYERPRVVKRYLNHDDPEAGRRKLARALRNAALAYGHREKARTCGYEVEDVYFFSVATLRELLPSVYDREAWIRVGRSEIQDTPRGKSSPAEGNNVIAALIDVKAAVERLPAEQRRLIEWQFRDGLDDVRIGLRLQTTEDAARKRIGRALVRLQDELGGERPDWNAARSHVRPVRDEGHGSAGALRACYASEWETGD